MIEILEITLCFLLFTALFAIKPALHHFLQKGQDRQQEEQINLAPAHPDPFDDKVDIEKNWEDRAVQWLNENKELSAIELVQQQTGMNFEEAQVKLLKLSEELDS